MIIIDANGKVFQTEIYLKDYFSGTPPFYYIFTPKVFITKFEKNFSPDINARPDNILINPWTYWNNDSKLESIRLQRDYFLGKSDWIVSKYAETLTEVPQNWRDYRQALRDFPSTVDVNLPIEQIVWPVSP
jgi:hypothetical protein